MLSSFADQDGKPPILLDTTLACGRGAPGESLVAEIRHVCVVVNFLSQVIFVSGVSVCICGFVALSVWMCVTGANKVEGTMQGTNKILASKHGIAALKVKQGHFETAILVLHDFVVF